MYSKDIYHLLSGAFSQCIAVPQIVDFNVFDIVTIGDIDFAIEIACALASRGRRGLWERACGLRRRLEEDCWKSMISHRSNGRYIGILKALSCL